MLKTLDKYIAESESQGGFLQSMWSRAGHDRRFALLLSLSVVFHVIFYAVIIKLDFWSAQEQKPSARKQGEIVQFIEVAPNDRYQRRPQPESLARADLNRLQFDPKNDDDTRLLSRSPKPSMQRGNDGSLPPADEIERRAKAARAVASRGAVVSPPNQSRPPQTTAVTSSGLPQPDSPVIAQAPVTRPSPAPPAPAQEKNVPATASNNQEPAPTGARRGDSSESNALGFERVQAQYISLVRLKVKRAHENLVPYKFIEDTLNNVVSAVYEVQLTRGGRLASVRLLRTTGYSRLDALAREAIYLASPFEGYPQNADDTISLTIKLDFDPFH